mmetsp:Transcript_33873/g.57525  ORF Transcript_33873/g.57525 Transcript_33873/m.57525 type:complete len:150 (-) Transcript_33873:77-526(-)
MPRTNYYRCGHLTNRMVLGGKHDRSLPNVQVEFIRVASTPPPKEVSVSREDACSFANCFDQFSYISSGSSNNDNRSVLQSLVDNIQLCGLYCCGGAVQSDYEEMNHADITKKMHDSSSDDNDTFIGKVVVCGNELPGCGGESRVFCAAL